jgi:hypothetical protein
LHIILLSRIFPLFSFIKTNVPIVYANTENLKTNFVCQHFRHSENQT